MRNPAQVLEVLSTRAKEDKTYKFDKLIKHFYNVEFYKAAYAKIQGNEGNMTKGSDGGSIDGFSLDKVDTLIELIKEEKYDPEPVKRVEIDKKNSNKKRHLGIPAFYDKLVQQVMVFLLEGIYEPTFSKYSHGYRPNKSCHTALMQVKNTFTGTKWWIEGDVKEFFDNIAHNTLINILRKRIKDDKFLRLVRKFLNSGYLWEKAYYKTYAGTPQGGIVSPILANIYLHELDEEIERMMNEFNTTKRQRKAHSEYKNISDKIGARRLKLDRLEPEERARLELELEELIKQRTEHRLSLPEGTIAEKDSTYKNYCKKILKIRRKLKEPSQEERRQIISEIKELNRDLRKLPAMDQLDKDFKRIKYIRYADDFLIGLIGSKKEAEEIKQHLSKFIKSELNLDLSQEKMLITHNSKKVRFLGYDIFVANKNEGKVALVENSGRRIRKRVDSGNIKLSLPHDILKNFLISKDYIKITNDGRWKGKHRPYLLVNDPLEIVRQYNAEFGGFYQYFKLAFDVKEKLGSVHQLVQHSFTRTLAGKFKTKVSKLRDYEIELNGHKYKAYVDGKDWGVRYKDKNDNVKFAELFPFRNIIVVKELPWNDPKANVIDEKHIINNYIRTSIIDRLEARECEWCGDKEGPFEVHHIRKLKDIKNKKSKETWELMHIYRNRKQMVLCGHGSKNNCHHKLHQGKLGNSKATGI